jgi:hypothetical protein
VDARASVPRSLGQTRPRSSRLTPYVEPAKGCQTYSVHGYASNQETELPGLDDTSMFEDQAGEKNNTADARYSVLRTVG